MAAKLASYRDYDEDIGRGSAVSSDSETESSDASTSPQGVRLLLNYITAINRTYLLQL